MCSSHRIHSSSSTVISAGNENPLKILIPTEYVGAVIGKGGGSIREMTKTTGARINVLRNWPHPPEKIVCIIGTPENCSAAIRRILDLCQSESETSRGTDVCLKIFVADTLIGRVIGKEGKNIKKVMQETQTKIHVSNQVQRDGWRSTNNPSQDERIVIIKGTTKGMARAAFLILQTVTRFLDRKSQQQQPQFNNIFYNF